MTRQIELVPVLTTDPADVSTSDECPEVMVLVSESNDVVGMYNVDAISRVQICNFVGCLSEAKISVSKSNGVVRRYNVCVSSLVRSWCWS